MRNSKEQNDNCPVHTKSIAPCCSSPLLAHMKINVGMLVVWRSL